MLRGLGWGENLVRSKRLAHDGGLSCAINVVEHLGQARANDAVGPVQILPRANPFLEGLKVRVVSFSLEKVLLTREKRNQKSAFNLSRHARTGYYFQTPSGKRGIESVLKFQASYGKHMDSCQRDRSRSPGGNHELSRWGLRSGQADSNV